MIPLIIVCAMLIVMIVIFYAYSTDKGAVGPTILVAFLLGMNLSGVFDRMVGPDGVGWNTVTYKAKTECEKSLPRDQECKVIVTAIPPKK